MSEKQKSVMLTPRLNKIAELIWPCNCMADIGTDHAYLPTYLCMEKRCTKAIASDINKGPLKRAEATIKRYKLEDKIELRLGGGVETLLMGEADTIVVAGMGGLVIAQILAKGIEVVKNATQLILQPMTAVDELRKYLVSNGFEIVGEHIVKEEEKIYNIIEVKYTGKEYTLKADEVYLGKNIKEKNPILYEEYFNRKKKRLEKILLALKKAESKEAEDKLKEVQALIDAIK